jgi:D-alanine---D-serine ligase
VDKRLEFFVNGRGERLEYKYDNTDMLTYAAGTFYTHDQNGNVLTDGITKVTSEKKLSDAITLAFRFDNEVIIEEAIPGFEVGCAVMGSGELIIGEPDEIELAGGMFDFKEKYTLETAAIHVPGRISQRNSDEVKQTARKIYKALGCSGFARVDMFVTPDGGIVFNEVNTIPGFTSHSRFPNMLKAIGMSMTQIITHAIELSINGHLDGRLTVENTYPQAV